MKSAVPDVIIDRAVTLWMRAILGGEWDNGDVMSRITHSALSPRDPENMGERVAKWGELVSARLKFLRDHDGEEMPESEWEVFAGHTSKTYRFDPGLRVDYHPDRVMKWAADQVEIRDFRFPAKSSTDFWDGDQVSASFGYGAPLEYHYPLPDGRWLITDLRGRADMKKVIAAIMAGNLQDFRIEAE